MAIPLIGAGITAGARGLASYLAKQKAKKAMMKAGYGATVNATLPSRFVSTATKPMWKPALAAGAAGTALYGLNSLSNHPRNKAMDRRQEGTYMANPMAGKSQNPSYDASMTREGRIQTMMEEMDGMGLSEDAKRQIIADKLSREKEYTITQDGMTYGVGFDSKPTDKVLRGLGEMKMFMGVPEGLRDKIERDKNTMNNDTAGWDPSQNIYPKFVIDQLIQNGTITPDEVFDLGASDGDSFKVIPKGTGRFDSARRA